MDKKFFLSEKEEQQYKQESKIPECITCEHLLDCPMEQKKGQGCLYYEVRSNG